MNIAFYLHDEKDPAAAREQLCALKERFRMVSGKEVRACCAGALTLKNACHVTIDDGWLSTYEVFFPILKELRIPASIFVSPKACAEGGAFWYQQYEKSDEARLKELMIARGLFREEVRAFPLELIFKELPVDVVLDVLAEYRAAQGKGVPARAVVTPEQLREMADSGLVEVGAHTLTHPILANETAERAEREISESVALLREMLERPVESFAYPNGLPWLDFGAREIEAVRKSGVRCAYSVRPGTFGRGNDAFAIPRVGSLKRVALGRLGLFLPSMHDQRRPRAAIRKLKI